MKLTFNQPHNLSQLHDELLEAIAEIRPVEGQAVMTVEGSGDVITLTIPDNLPGDVPTSIALVVASHTPVTAQPEPDWSQESGLAFKLFGSPLHLKLRNAAQTNQVCAIAYQEIMSAINGHNPALLGLGLNGAIAALAQMGNAATTEEKQQLQVWLNECHILINVGAGVI